MTAARRKPKVPRRLYLISAADYLETAFFCGTAEECIEVLGMKSKECFYCAISKKEAVFQDKGPQLPARQQTRREHG